MTKKVIVLCSIFFSVFIGCKNNEGDAAPKSKLKPHAQTTPKSKNFSDLGQQNQAAGKIIDTMNSGGYTYIEVDSNGSKFWAAGPETKVNIGDTVEIPSGTMMSNFTSNTLNRTFEKITFVPYFLLNGKMSNTTVKKADTSKSDEPIKVEKAAGGYTIEELFSQRESLKGKTVRVKGKITKFSQGIMGKNWTHMKDGTGKEGSNDLTLTTLDVANVGDVITMEGTVFVDKDFGGGYFYPLIIEDTKIVK